MRELPQILVNGLIAGGIYALVAVGYALAYGVLRLINFAHGSVCTAGAFVALTLLTETKLSLPVVVLAVMGFGAGLGLVVERIAYRPIRSAPPIVGLITALGVAAIIENTIALFFGPDARSLPPGFFPVGSLGVEGWMKLSYIQCLTIIIVPLVLGGLWLTIYRTKLGCEMRAVADNKLLAETMGINGNKVVSIGFAAGSAIGACAGLIVAADLGCDPYMGMILGFKAFAACVLGGIGSIAGAVMGGLALGVFENLIAGYVSTEYKSAAVMAALLIMLLLRPEGLFRAFIRRIS